MTDSYPDRKIHGIYILDSKTYRWFRRKRGMVSNPFFITPDLFLLFLDELFYGYLRFEGNGKIPLGRQGKKCPLLDVSF